LKEVVALYYLLHTVIFTLFYLSLRKLYKFILISGETIIVFSLIILMFFVEKFYFIPNQRWIFYNILDPEFITYPVVLFSIVCHLEKKYIKSSIFLGITTLLHPLYGLLLFGSYLLSFIVCNKDYLKKLIIQSLVYAVAVFPYSIVVWFCSKQTVKSDFDPSLIVEIIRAPHHYKIPTFQSIFSISSPDFITVVFYIDF
jgi:hypothetical protein